MLLHTNGVFWSRPHGRLWISANFLETFFYFAVPVFFMIYGATLLDYRNKYSTSVFLKKRFSKVLFPFLFWSFIAGIFSAKIYSQQFDWNFLHILDNILHTRYFNIYWFFLALFAVYLSMPLLSAVENKIEVYSYTAVIGIICIGILPLVCSLLGVDTWAIMPPVAEKYIFYVLLGYILEKKTIEKKYRICIYVLGIFGWGLHFFGTLYMSAGTSEINSIFKGYQNIPAIMHSISIFVLLKNINYRKIFRKQYELFEKIVNKIASLTFGVYLIHNFFIIYLTTKFQININTLSWRLGGGMIIFICCVLITWIIQKIPCIKWILP